jgi:hypothetical protein
MKEQLDNQDIKTICKPYFEAIKKVLAGSHIKEFHNILATCSDNLLKEVYPDKSHRELPYEKIDILPEKFVCMAIIARFEYEFLENGEYSEFYKQTFNKEQREKARKNLEEYCDEMLL